MRNGSETLSGSGIVGVQLSGAGLKVLLTFGAASVLLTFANRAVFGQCSGIG